MLHVISGLTRGGAETFLFRLTPQLRVHGVDSVVVSMTDDGELAPLIRQAGVPVISLGMVAPRPPLREVHRLCRVFDASMPDVVMSWLPHADVIGGAVARVKGVPVVWNLRSSMSVEDESRTHRAIVRIQARTSNLIPTRIVCASERVREAHCSVGFDVDRTQVIHNGFDTDVFRPDSGSRKAVRSELGLGERTVVVGHVARFDPVKDHATSLRAFARFRRRNPDAVLVMCGSGTDTPSEAIRDVIEAEGLATHVRLLGDRPDMPRLVNAFDVALSSSRFEGLSNAIGEAMSCDVPSVSTDTGAAGELIGPTGIVVPVGASELLGDAIGDVLHGVRPSPRERILERFSLDKAAAQYAALFDSVHCSNKSN